MPLHFFCVNKYIQLLITLDKSYNLTGSDKIQDKTNVILQNTSITFSAELLWNVVKYQTALQKNLLQVFTSLTYVNVHFELSKNIKKTSANFTKKEWRIWQTEI